MSVTMFHTVLDKCTNSGHDSGALTYHKACNIVTEKESYLKDCNTL